MGAASPRQTCSLLRPVSWTPWVYWVRARAMIPSAASGTEFPWRKVQETKESLGWTEKTEETAYIKEEEDNFHLLGDVGSLDSMLLSISVYLEFVPFPLDDWLRPNRNSQTFLILKFKPPVTSSSCLWTWKPFLEHQNTCQNLKYSSMVEMNSFVLS